MDVSLEVRAPERKSSRYSSIVHHLQYKIAHYAMRLEKALAY